MPDFEKKADLSSALNISKPVRVLQVVTTMNRGGLETMLMNYYRHMDRNQIQFDFLVHRDQESDYKQEILALGGRVYRIQPMNPFSRSYKKALREFFQSHPEYRIIHVHQDCMSSIALSEARRCGIPVRIAHCHNSNQDKDIKYPIKMFNKRKIKDEATVLLSCGSKSGKWMFGTDDFHVLNNAIDTEKFRYSESGRNRIRQEFHIPDDYLLIGHVGRFNKTKNHEFLVRVFSEFVKRQEKSFLLLAGIGNEQEQIRKLVTELGLQDKVIFAGLRSDVSEVMSALDIFVMPSLYEGTPMVLIEAQTSGLPCLISDSIPSDCDLTSLVIRCSLDDGIDPWVIALEKIETIETINRTDSYLQIRDKGFDVSKNASWLQNYYLKSADR